MVRERWNEHFCMTQVLFDSLFLCSLDCDVMNTHDDHDWLSSPAPFPKKKSEEGSAPASLLTRRLLLTAQARSSFLSYTSLKCRGPSYLQTLMTECHLMRLSYGT